MEFKKNLKDLLQGVPNNKLRRIEYLLTDVIRSPSVYDEKQIGTLFIDCQFDFANKEGTLFVPGADLDMERIVLWIYNNLYKITTFGVTRDSHKKESIFFKKWWQDRNGNYPSDYTKITYNDVVNGTWIPTSKLAYTKRYMKFEKEIVIWPYHCITGTKGAKLDIFIERMKKIHEVLRTTTSICFEKGKDPNREMFGALKPAYDYDDFYLNKDLIKYINSHELIVIAGIAGSHCVPVTINQILEYYKHSPEIVQKLVVLQDCISPVTGFEDIQELEMKKFKALGIRCVNSTEFNL